MDESLCKLLVEGQVTASRPPGVAALAWWICLSGVLGFFVAPFYIPWRWGPFGAPSPPVAVAAATTIASFSAVITYGLLRGRLWAWFAAWSVAFAILCLRGLWIADRVDAGFGLVDTVLSSVSGVYVTAYGAAVPLILASRRTRRWFFFARRLRSMSPERLKVYMHDESLLHGVRD